MQCLLYSHLCTLYKLRTHLSHTNIVKRSELFNCNVDRSQKSDVGIRYVDKVDVGTK